MNISSIDCFLVFLLYYIIYLCWLLSREKSYLEVRLVDLGDKGGKFEEFIIVILNYIKFDLVWYGEN